MSRSVAARRLLQDAARRQIAGGHGGGQHDRADRREHAGVGRRDAEEHAGDGARRQQRQHEPGERADDGEPGRACQHQPHERRWLGAQRHADAHLARTLRDGVGDEAVDAEHRQPQRRRRERRDEPQVEASRADRLVEAGAHRRQLVGRRRRDIAHDPAHRLRQGAQAGPAHDDREASTWCAAAAARRRRSRARAALRATARGRRRPRRRRAGPSGRRPCCRTGCSGPADRGRATAPRPGSG